MSFDRFNTTKKVNCKMINLNFEDARPFVYIFKIITVQLAWMDPSPNSHLLQWLGHLPSLAGSQALFKYYTNRSKSVEYIKHD